MSWSASGTARVDDQTAGVVHLYVHDIPQQGYGDAASANALRIVRELAAEAIRQGVLGSGPFSVILSGHSNPDFKGGDHGDGTHWSPDRLNIEIESQATHDG
ncbi:MAG: hypothetical protein ACRDNS_14240 [Trebonia sp.]